MNYDLPPKNIAEITLIGTGGGYGESCVIHLGDNTWVVVDSCIDPSKNECLPLRYLTDLNVNIKKDVKYIICTHWHDDHIQGLSKLMRECENATLCFGDATDMKKFLYWVTLDYQKLNNKSSISSTKEFVECVKIARERGTSVVKAVSDKLLHASHDGSIRMTALSPSNFTVAEFDKEIGELIENYGSPIKKYVKHSPNDKSVVLLIELNGHYAILGADLEVNADNRKGWLAILDSSMAIRGKKASLFKISHHGSENGYHERIWNELLSEQPIAKLTPWNLNKGLPNPDMLKIYCNHTENVYMTSPIINTSKPKKRDKTLEKIINTFNKKISEVKFNKGIVRNRIDLNNPTMNWQIELEGEGFHVNQLIS